MNRKEPHTWFQGERYNLVDDEYVRDTFYDTTDRICENCKLSFDKENILICARTINQIQPDYHCEKFTYKK